MRLYIFISLYSVFSHYMFAMQDVVKSTATPIDMLKENCAQELVKKSLLPALPSQCLETLISTTQDVSFEQMPKRIRNWGSQGRTGKAWKFHDPACNDFFIKIFSKLSHQKNLKLSPFDLFHAHLITFVDEIKNTQSLMMVFHAKEYPADLEMIKNRYQIPTESFKSTDNVFNKRNFIYVNSVNSEANLYFVKNEGVCKNYFLTQAPSTLSEELLAQDLFLGRLIGDVNVFLPENIGRIAYQFYPGFHLTTGSFYEDLEGSETKKSVQYRLLENSTLKRYISLQKNNPIIYFLTGKSNI